LVESQGFLGLKVPVLEYLGFGNLQSLRVFITLGDLTSCAPGGSKISYNLRECEFSSISSAATRSEETEEQRLLSI
jgi:hypothetical protein